MHKNWVEKVFFPHDFIIFLLINSSIVLLVYSLGYEYAIPVIQYVSYVLSMYTLIIFVIRCVQIGIRVKRFIYKNHWTRSLLEEKDKRFIYSLGIGLLWNLVFGILKMVLGIVYHSNWLIALGEYYILLSIMRSLLFIIEWNGRKKGTYDVYKGWKSHGICGMIMLVLHLVMVGMVFLMIKFDRSFAYPGVMVYVFALYAFYSMGMSIYDLIRYWKDNNPVIVAGKKIRFASALMSILALQSALLTQFSNSKSEQLILNSLTSTVVCVLNLVIAISMITNAKHKLQEFK